MPQISVIMGVYNSKSKYLLEKSIRSVIEQTFTDWEFIICDDGSTDDTPELLKKLAALDNRIRIITNSENKGLAFSLNHCLKYAKGEYIARQDDDDESKPKRFLREMEFLDNHRDYAWVGCKADISDDSGIRGEYPVPEKPEKTSFLWNSPFIHPSIMIRRDDILSVGGYRVSRETRRGQDYDMFMRLYAAGKKGYNLQEKLYIYRSVNDPNKRSRPFTYRVDEMKIRYRGFKGMGILFKGVPYIIKPILVGMIPQRIIYRINKNKHRQQ